MTEILEADFLRRTAARMSHEELVDRFLRVNLLAAEMDENLETDADVTELEEVEAWGDILRVELLRRVGQ